MALDAIPEAERTTDQNLLIRIKLLAVEGLCRAGRPTEALSLMAGIFRADRDHPIELVAEAMRVTGRLTADVDREGAKAHFERAAQAAQPLGIRRHLTRSPVMRSIRRVSHLIFAPEHSDEARNRALTSVRSELSHSAVGPFLL